MKIDLGHSVANEFLMVRMDHKIVKGSVGIVVVKEILEVQVEEIDIETLHMSPPLSLLGTLAHRVFLLREHHSPV